MTRIDERALRDALGTFATGITIVTTTNARGQAVGITVNSFTSVSLQPPLVLWCLADSAESYNDFVNCSNFAVHVLHEGQQAVSEAFATKNNNKFSHMKWQTGDCGSPILADFSCCFQCTTEATYAGGDHVILLGRVNTMQTREDRKPLIYYAGKYRALKS